MPFDLNSTYEKLKVPPPDADAKWFQARGYSFEKILMELLERENLKPRASYKPEGEQIDGSFLYEGRVFLFEAKWWNKEVAASSVYEFKAKVDGKLLGTLGVFISMSGFSEDTPKALEKGKSLNVILFDRDDMDFAIKEEIGFCKVLESKLRLAAEEGLVYFPFSKLEISKPKSGDIIEKITINSDIIFTPDDEDSSVYIICEGSLDREIIGAFLKRLLPIYSIETRFKILVAMGKYNIPKMVNALSHTRPATIIIVADSDFKRDKSMELFSTKINISNYNLILPEPTIEKAWLDTDKDLIHSMTKDNNLESAYVHELIAALVGKVNLEKLRKTDDSFERFFGLIVHLFRLTQQTTSG